MYTRNVLGVPPWLSTAFLRLNAVSAQSCCDHLTLLCAKSHGTVGPPVMSLTLVGNHASRYVNRRDAQNICHHVDL